MSNSGEEEGLTTPSEESAEEEVKVQNHKEGNGHTSLSVNAVSGAKIESVTNMARSNSSDREAVEDSKLPRRFVQISEENLLLKKQLRKQEERIKILATKLIRVISERSNKTKREEILLDEQKARIADLEHEVSILREKLSVTKQQLSSYTRLIPHHHHPPPSRQTSMLSFSSATTHSKAPKKTGPSRSTSGGLSQPHRPSTASTSRGNLHVDKNFADRVEELLLEAKAENQALEDQLKNCRLRLSSTEETLEKLKETLKNKESEHQEEILSIKSQLGKEEDITKKKKQLSDNIQLIRLQRESRRTASWLSTLETQNRALEANLTSTTENLQGLETQLSELQEELAQEQQKNIMLQKQLEDSISSQSRMKELEAQITALQDENKILQETNESLLKNAFSVREKAEKAESLESHMRAQMTHLETALKAEMRSKSDIEESLCMEREKCMRLEISNEKIQESLNKLNDEIKRREEICCGNTNQSSTNIQSTAETTTSNNIDNNNDNNSTNHDHDKISEIRVTNLEKELAQTKQQLLSEKEEHEKTSLLLKTQVTETEKQQRKIEELLLENKKEDDFHCKKLHELVKGLEERKKQISELEKSMDEWKRQQSSVSCKVCNSRIKINEDVEETTVASKEAVTDDNVEHDKVGEEEELNNANPDEIDEEDTVKNDESAVVEGLSNEDEF